MITCYLVAFALLSQIVSTSNEVPWVLLGYYENDLIALPKLTIKSSGMTLSKCMTICGQRKFYYVYIKDNDCECGTNLAKTSVSWKTECQQPIPCPGDPEETCGCVGLKAFYNGEFTGQCLLKLYLGSHKYASSTSDLTIQVYGDAGECNEARLPQKTVTSLSSASVSSGCPALGNEIRIRMGIANPSDGYQIDKVTIEMPTDTRKFPQVTHNFIVFKYGGWLGTDSAMVGTSNGSPYRVVDVYANGTSSSVLYSYPEIDGGRNYKNFTTAPSSYFTYCATNTGCKADTTYVSLEGYFYKHLMLLPQLYILNQRNGCFDPDKPSSSNITYNFKPASNNYSTSAGTTVTYSCTAGYFSISKTQTLKITCNSAGIWEGPNLNQICVLDCTEPVPSQPDNSIANYTKEIAQYGTVIRYQCINRVWGGSLLHKIFIRCQENGKWSMSKLPPCIQVPINMPGPILTSNLKTTS
ncbi:hypothetical protein CHUAL_008037 [Chamberlinius hualienensis]